MAKLVFSQATLQRVLSDDISGRMLLDLSKPGPRSPKWSRDYDEHITSISKNLAELSSTRLNREVKRRYNDGISQIQDLLKTGIKKSNSISLSKVGGQSVDIGGWAALQWRYIQTKPKETKGKFWKNRLKHGLSEKFDAFANEHKADVSQQKATIALNKRGVKNRIKGLGTVYRYDLTFTLPKPYLGQGYLEDLFQTSFFTGEGFEGHGYGLYDGMDVLGYLEGPSETTFSKHRPFMGELMASHGIAFTKSVGRIVNNLAVDNQVI